MWIDVSIATHFAFVFYIFFSKTIIGGEKTVVELALIHCELIGCWKVGVTLQNRL